MLQLQFQTKKPEAGCDEAGRGCLAGPVFAAAVVLPSKFKLAELNDSKKLNELQRLRCREYILKHALSFSVSMVDEKEIDKINILNASIRAMHLALRKLKVNPAFIIIDGNRFKPFEKIPYQTIIKGDGKFASIAAASVLAKTFRDDFMNKLHLEYPQYDWKKNKGYPTLQHRAAIKEFGACRYHRKTFRLLEDAEQLNLL